MAYMRRHTFCIVSTDHNPVVLLVLVVGLGRLGLRKQVVSDMQY